jgi:serine-type D-Ala-D-Ala carboxypeptidase/endopeptidase (penicillin-binding protein 4)
MIFRSSLLIMPIISAILASGLPAIAQPATAQPQICPAFARDVDAIVKHPKFRHAQFGILIQDSKPNTLYAHNAERLLIPASNAKILTTAAALRSLPLNFTVKTSLYDLGNGEFQLVGQGDPTLQDQHLQQLAKSLIDRKIKQIKTLFLDDRYYGKDWVNPSWEWEDIQADYAPPISGLILNENAIGLTLTPAAIGQSLVVKWNDPENAKNYRVENLTKTVAIDQPEFVAIAQPEPGVVLVTGQLRIGAEAEPVGISVQKPTQLFADRLRRIFESVGIVVGAIEPVGTGERLVGIASRNGNPPKSPLGRGTSEPPISSSVVPSPILSPLPKGARGIATITSPPLSDWIQETNQVSNNLYAESLLRQLGTSDQNPMGEGFTSDRGLAVLNQTLTKMGVDPNSYKLVDGSGLARRNWVSAEAIVQVLQAMKDDQTFRRSLPSSIAGGNLNKRFKNTAAEGIVSAKTGYLTGAIGLSGYVTRPDIQPIFFSILLNHATVPLAEQMKAVDAIVVRLANLKSCE